MQIDTGCRACGELPVESCVCGEVVCLSCSRKLNRRDLSCYACGGVKLDRTKVDAIHTTAEQTQSELVMGAAAADILSWWSSTYRVALWCDGCARREEDTLILPTLREDHGGQGYCGGTFGARCPTNCNTVHGCKC